MNVVEDVKDKLEIDLPRKAWATLLPSHTPKGLRVRYRCLYGGRDAAKSHSVARYLLARGRAKKERILCVREIQHSIAESVHKLFSDLIEAMELTWFYNVQKTAIIGINGTEFVFHGLSHQTRDSLKSQEGTTLCWVEEGQKISKTSWNILEPTIRAPESEIIVTFNPYMDSDEIYIKFVENPSDDAIVTYINWKDNPWRSTVLDAARERMQREDPQDYENIYEGKCRSSVEGAIYANELREALEGGRIRPMPYDPRLKVHTIWDLGWNDRMSIIFCQRLLNQLMVIDFLEDQFRKYDWYVNAIKAKGYNLGQAFLPHDAGHESPLLADNPVTTLRKLGLDCAEPLKAESVEVGIKRVRMTFPRIYIDEVKGRGLLDHLKRYRRSIPTTTNEPQGALHDEHSHAADALRYMCACAEQMTNDQKDAPLKFPDLGINFRRRA